MASFPSLPLWTDAYLADTRHLTAQEHGAYLLLLMTAWRSKDCSLPNDDKKLARMASCDLRTWKKIKDTVLEFFDVQDQKLYQKRLLKERNFVEEKRDQAKRAGKASALKRKETRSTDVTTEDQQKPNITTPTPTPTPNKDTNVSYKPYSPLEPKPTKIEPTPEPPPNGFSMADFGVIPKPRPAQPEEPPQRGSKRKPMAGYSAEFEAWWGHYPKKVAKDRARKAFEAVLKAEKASLHELQAGVMRYGAERDGQDPKYTKHAATWLNDGCWADEPTPEPPPNSGQPVTAPKRKVGIVADMEKMMKERYGV